MSLPTPVGLAIRLEPVTLRNFRTPYHRSTCGNCTWESYDYPTADEAEDAGLAHGERCCLRLNMELALLVEVTPTAVEDLAPGQRLLLKDLRTLLVHEVAVIDATVLITYAMDECEADLLELPLGHIVKVVEL